MTKKEKALQYYEAVGRRREAVASVRLYLVTGKDEMATIKNEKYKKGSIIINGKDSSTYYPSIAHKEILLAPLKSSESVDRFVISIKAHGGGKEGQLDAVVLGISRALLLVNEEYRPALRQLGLLTRDPRIKERRKVGMGGKSRRAKQSPKR